MNDMRALGGAAALAGLALLTGACGGGQPSGPGVSSPASTAPGEAAGPYGERKKRFLEAYMRKDFATAAKEAEKAIELSPSIREPYMFLSKTLIDSGQDQEAVRVFSGLAERFEERADPWFFLGFHQARLGQWDESRHSLERAVALAPGDAEARHRLGLVLGETGDSTQGLTALRSAVQLDPNSPGKAASLMVALHTAGLDADADAMAEALIAKSPLSAESQYAVARLRIAQERFAEAEVALRKCLNLSPNFPPAKADLQALEARAASAKQAPPRSR